jgi:hypothetical protein
MRKDSGAINIVHNYTTENSQPLPNDCSSPLLQSSMSREFVAESTGFPLKRLDSRNKNSTDVESELTEDKQVDGHVQPLSSGELS